MKEQNMKHLALRDLLTVWKSWKRREIGRILLIILNGTTYYSFPIRFHRWSLPLPLPPPPPPESS
jgi:hypothetical protein